MFKVSFDTKYNLSFYEKLMSALIGRDELPVSLNVKTGELKPAITKRAIDKIEKGFGDLSERHRRLILKRFDCEEGVRTYQSIGEEESYTGSNIESQIKKAFGILRKKVKPQDVFIGDRCDFLETENEMLKKRLEVFLSQEEEAEKYLATDKKQSLFMRLVSSCNPLLFMERDELLLQIRTDNCLRNLHLNYIFQIVLEDERFFLNSKNFGRKSLNNLKENLACSGFSLGMSLNDLGDAEDVFSDLLFLAESKSDFYESGLPFDGVLQTFIKNLVKGRSKISKEKIFNIVEKFRSEILEMEIYKLFGYQRFFRLENKGVKKISDILCKSREDAHLFFERIFYYDGAALVNTLDFLGLEFAE